ncbi:MAG TPA: hypothetical protein VNV61_08670 [Steroidobacteraceae bacterium]|jgi:hypothetical protein|nr:hypothetical protein [Steroidobacteraceae bacterium]
MAMSTRREFVLLTGGAAVGCVARGTTAPAPSDSPPVVRAPAVGQSWRYAKHDYFTRSIVDTQIDRVSKIGQSVEIESRSEAAGDKAIKYPSWGERWWHEYMGTDTSAARIPTEVQKPWGMIIVDPHWSELQAFEKAIPLWPTQLRPGWSTNVSTQYMIPDSNETMPSQLTMSAQRWESITVPAGRFNALRYYNIIDFRFTNVSERTAALRQEYIWFAPEIGRWVVRESRGIFREDVGTEVKESSYRWELLSWA